MNDFAPRPEWMQLALRQAEQAFAEGEVPVGAIVVRDGVVIAAAHNRREQDHDPTSHAELRAIRLAAEQLGDWRLEDCQLYVTLEPCVMCAGAILQARLPIVVFGAWDPKAGAVETLYRLLNDSRMNHQVEVHAGIEAAPCGEILTRFFKAQRALGKK